MGDTTDDRLHEPVKTDSESIPVPPGDQRVFHEIDLLAQLHEYKAQRYGRPDDWLLNFHQTAERWGDQAWKVAMKRVEEKMVRITRAATEPELYSREEMENEFKDIALLSLLGLVLWREVQDPVNVEQLRQDIAQSLSAELRGTGIIGGDVRKPLKPPR